MITYFGISVRRLWLLVPMSFGLSGLALAGSRAGMSTLVFGVLIIILFLRRFLLLTLIVFAFWVVVTVMAFAELELERLSRVYELIYWIRGIGPLPLTFQLRLINWVAAISYYASQKTVWTGITIIGKRSGMLAVDSFDNEYLLYFVWNGIIGFFAFIVFQIGLFSYSLRLTVKSMNIELIKTLSIFILSISFSLSIIAVTQEVWSQQRLLHLIFICLGLLVYSRLIMNCQKDDLLRN
ncbi:MAG: hypothetical protein R3A44_29415 [Caldilineaceae bacterium]